MKSGADRRKLANFSTMGQPIHHIVEMVKRMVGVDYGGLYALAIADSIANNFTNRQWNFVIEYF